MKKLDLRDLHRCDFVEHVGRGFCGWWTETLRNGLGFFALFSLVYVVVSRLVVALISNVKEARYADQIHRAFYRPLPPRSGDAPDALRVPEAAGDPALEVNSLTGRIDDLNELSEKISADYATGGFARTDKEKLLASVNELRAVLQRSVARGLAALSQLRPADVGEEVVQRYFASGYLRLEQCADVLECRKKAAVPARRKRRAPARKRGAED